MRYAVRVKEIIVRYDIAVTSVCVIITLFIIRIKENLIAVQRRADDLIELRARARVCYGYIRSIDNLNIERRCAIASIRSYKRCRIVHCVPYERYENLFFGRFYFRGILFYCGRRCDLFARRRIYDAEVAYVQYPICIVGACVIRIEYVRRRTIQQIVKIQRVVCAFRIRCKTNSATVASRTPFVAFRLLLTTRQYHCRICITVRIKQIIKCYNVAFFF